MLNPFILRYLLDTNIVIAFFAQEARVLQQLSQASGAQHGPILVSRDAHLGEITGLRVVIW